MPTPPMPISPRYFLASFVFTSFIFLPVPFFAVVAISIAPVSALLPFAYSLGWREGLFPLGILLAYALIYIGIFYLLGAVFYRLARAIPTRRAQWGFLIGILIVPVLCSFSRVYTDRLGGKHGPYTFWEGAAGILKK